MWKIYIFLYELFNKKKKKKKKKLQRFYIIPIDCSMRLTFPLKIDSDKLSRFLVAMSTGSGKGNVPKSSR